MSYENNYDFRNYVKKKDFEACFGIDIGTACQSQTLLIVITVLICRVLRST